MQHQTQTTQSPPWHLRVMRYRQLWHTHANLPSFTQPCSFQGYTELTKSSSHKRGGGNVRPGCRREGSSGCQGLQKLHRWPAQAPVRLHGGWSEGATCPPPPYLRNLDASLKEAAACAACWKKLLAAGWTTETSVTAKPSSGSTTSMSPRSKDALPVPARSRSIAGSTAVATPAQ
jgi:hypothetical protein